MLNREPMGMKRNNLLSATEFMVCFSAQPRADGDEAGIAVCCASAEGIVSVLNREPMGMKHTPTSWRLVNEQSFSAQPRADGDEAQPSVSTPWRDPQFQCSTASRWG